MRRTTPRGIPMTSAASAIFIITSAALGLPCLQLSDSTSPASTAIANGTTPFATARRRPGDDEDEDGAGPMRNHSFGNVVRENDAAYQRSGNTSRTRVDRDDGNFLTISDTIKTLLASESSYVSIASSLSSASYASNKFMTSPIASSALPAIANSAALPSRVRKRGNAVTSRNDALEFEGNISRQLVTSQDMEALQRGELCFDILMPVAYYCVYPKPSWSWFPERNSSAETYANETAKPSPEINASSSSSSSTSTSMLLSTTENDIVNEWPSNYSPCQLCGNIDGDNGVLMEDMIAGEDVNGENAYTCEMVENWLNGKYNGVVPTMSCEEGKGAWSTICCATAPLDDDAPPLVDFAENNGEPAVVTTVDASIGRDDASSSSSLQSRSDQPTTTRTFPPTDSYCELCGNTGNVDTVLVSERIAGQDAAGTNQYTCAVAENWLNGEYLNVEPTMTCENGRKAWSTVCCAVLSTSDVDRVVGDGEDDAPAIAAAADSALRPSSPLADSSAKPPYCRLCASYLLFRPTEIAGYAEEIRTNAYTCEVAENWLNSWYDSALPTISCEKGQQLWNAVCCGIRSDPALEDSNIGSIPASRPNANQTTTTSSADTTDGAEDSASLLQPITALSESSSSSLSILPPLFSCQLCKDDAVLRPQGVAGYAPEQKAYTCEVAENWLNGLYSKSPYNASPTVSCEIGQRTWRAVCCINKTDDDAVRDIVISDERTTTAALEGADASTDGLAIASPETVKYSCIGLEVLGACIGSSTGCIGLNVGGARLGPIKWSDLSVSLFPFRFIHQYFSPSCVGIGDGNTGNDESGETRLVGVWVFDDARDNRT